jgi:hypothetical protein
LINIEILKSKFKDVEEIEENIFLIKNFITEQEQKDILSIAQLATEEDWKKDYIDSLKEESLTYSSDQWIDKSLNINNGDIPILLKHRLQDGIGNSYSVKKFLTIQRHYPGSSLAEHIDEDHDPLLKYASVLYLNEDYNGGHLYFPKLNLDIKAPEKSLILFSTGQEYLHGVTEVLNGPTRYVIATFIWKND